VFCSHIQLGVGVCLKQKLWNLTDKSIYESKRSKYELISKNCRSKSHTVLSTKLSYWKLTPPGTWMNNDEVHFNNTMTHSWLMIAFSFVMHYCSCFSAKMKICDFDRQFLSFSYLFCFAQNNKSFKAKSNRPSSLWLCKKNITLTHPVINTQWHAKVELGPFHTSTFGRIECNSTYLFWDTCIKKGHKILEAKILYIFCWFYTPNIA
jgi:hypothetical protein